MQHKIATSLLACIATVCAFAQPDQHGIAADSGKWLQAGIYGDSYGQTDWAAALRHQFSTSLKTAFNAGYTHDFMDKDVNNDGFRDLPKKKQLNVSNSWHYSKGRYTACFGFETLNNANTGGSMHFNGRRADTTNYGAFTQRDMATAWTNHSIAFSRRNKAEAALAYTYDRSNSLYGVRTNENTLNTYDVQASYIRTFNKQHTLRAGATHNGFLTSNTLGLKDSIYIDDIETEAYDFTTGIFAEYTYKINSILRINARMNADWSNWFGFFYAPEVSIDYFPYKSLLINANVSRSKNQIDIFANNSHPLMSSRQVIIGFPYDREQKWNFSLSATQKFKLFGRDFFIMAGYERIQFERYLVIDFDHSDEEVFFHFSDEEAHSDIITLSAQYEITKGLHAATSWRRNNAMQTIDGRLRHTPFTNDYDGTVSLSYTTPRYDIGIEADAQFYGGGRLPMAIDGSTRFDAYQLYNARISKGFGPVQIYAGVSNISDKRQRHPVLGHDNPFGKGFDATMIYAPLKGRTYYLGVRFDLEKQPGR